MKARNNYTPEFKAKVVLEILSEEEQSTKSPPSTRLSPVVISRWKERVPGTSIRGIKKGPSKAE